ncbi:MAG: hypothetical protein IIZ59_01970 [Clostridia bacterium]|nr:hypothetical protein [Clostridia bacterium]
MMKKKTTFGFALTCVLVAAAIAFAVGYLVAGNKVKQITDTAAAGEVNEQVAEVDKVIRENYLGTINESAMIKGMCRGYVEGLGDNSVKYLTAAEYANYNKSAAGETIIYKNFGKGVGYIQFFGFEDSTKSSFSAALNDFSGSSISKVDMLVFDLRSCTSGKIEVAAQILDMLLPEGETIAGVDKNGNRTVLYTSDQSAIAYDIAVLVNGNTSGVAEIFASTLNAYGKAFIVGTTTAGDCAQTEAIPLSSGDYVLIPSLYYVTKGQMTVSSTGVVPTNPVELSISDQKSYESGTLDLSADAQFLEAVKALGVNDIIMPGNASSDSDRNSSDKDKNSSDSDRTSSNPGRITTESDTDTASDTDTETLDPHWDDDEYWNSKPSEDGGNNVDEDDEEYYDNGEDDEYYYDDNNDYDEEEDEDW